MKDNMDCIAETASFSSWCGGHMVVCAKSMKNRL